MQKTLAGIVRYLMLSGAIFASLTLIISLISRVYKIDKFPIYFFCDEAFHQIYAQALLDNGFRDSRGVLLPLYIEKASNRWVPQITLYLYMLPVLIWGKSVVLTRLVTAIFAVLGAWGAALVLKRGFGLRYWWTAIPVLCVMPVWLLHSRTAFETVLVVAFIPWFLYSYIRYLSGEKTWILVATFLGAIIAYSHFSGMIVICSLALLLFLSDLRLHLNNWRYLALALVVSGVLLIPFFRFRLSNPGAMVQQLQVIESPWVREDLSLGEKFRTTGERYLSAYSPSYWFTAHTRDGERHFWKDREYIPSWLLPFMVLGGIIAALGFKHSKYRLVWALMLASGAPVLVVQLLVMRVFYLIIPITLLVVIGLNWLLCLGDENRSSASLADNLRLNKLLGDISPKEEAYASRDSDKPKGPLNKLRKLANSAISYVFISSVLTIFTGAFSWRLMNEALVEAPKWYGDYYLFGVQWGGQELYDAIKEEQRSDERARFLVTPEWANAAGNFHKFYLTPEEQKRVTSAQLREVVFKGTPLDPDGIYVVTEPEYKVAQQSPKVVIDRVVRTILNPKGDPQFRFIKLHYVPELAEILRREKDERQKPVESVVEVEGEKWLVRHSVGDLGSAFNMFDGNRSSVLRGLEANPFKIEIEFPSARSFSSVSVGLFPMRAKVDVIAEGDMGTTASFSGSKNTTEEDDTIILSSGERLEDIKTLKFEITELNKGIQDEIHIHIREIKLHP